MNRKKIAQTGQQVTHTPTPWIQEETFVFSSINTIRIADCDCDGQTMKYKEARANAAYIVQCVNSHEALVDALKRAHTVLRHMKGYFTSAECKEITDALVQAEHP